MNISKNKFRSNEIKDYSFLSLLKTCLFFFAIFSLICVAFSSITSLIFYQTLNPNKMVDFASISSLYLSAFLTSFLLSKKTGQKYILGGALLGAIILCVLFVAAVFTDTKIISSEFLFKAMVPIVCMFGAVLGIKREKQNKKRSYKW